MAGLRMPAPEKLVITKRPRLRLSDELVILRSWTWDPQWASAIVMVSVTRQVAMLRGRVKCAGCGRGLYSRAEYQYDHERPRKLGGSDGVENLRPYCVTRKVSGLVAVGCHNLKTARDVAMIAKAKRQARETCNGPTRNPIPARKNPWPPKGSRKIPSRARGPGRKPRGTKSRSGTE